jgi:hypothetical protein
MGTVYFATMPIFETFSLLLAGAGIWFWLDTLKAREIGVVAAQRACAEEGLLFLDETVAGRSVRPARDGDGQFKLRRIFEFEYSDTGNNRRSGSVTMLGNEVEIMHVRPNLYVIPNANETLH